MSVKIRRLKLRVPAGTARNPEAFARSVAQRLAKETAGYGAHKADNVHLKLPKPRGDAAGIIARAIGRAVRGRES
jgi:hypothetical protein